MLNHLRCMKSLDLGLGQLKKNVVYITEVLCKKLDYTTNDSKLISTKLCVFNNLFTVYLWSDLSPPDAKQSAVLPCQVVRPSVRDVKIL